MTWADWEEALFSLCIWREASGEGEAGMRAVAHVVANRVFDPQCAFGRGYAGVVAQKNQFSAMTIAGDPSTVRWPTPNDSSFAAAMRIATEVLRGQSIDPTRGATFYRNPKTATSEWFEKNIAQNPDFYLSASIGHHVFYARRPVPKEAKDAGSLWGAA